MKFNWGTGIAVFYSFFVLVLVFAVYRSTQYDNSLVSDHYYADDLAYQQHYNKLVNAQQLEEDLKIWNKIQKREVELHFPAEFKEVAGEIYFFCPSDKQSDFRLPVQAGDDHVQRIPTEGLRPGRWKVKVNWKAGGKEFYKEESITI
ncbi:MAG: FixH family protein [Phaeodactylibacter sp.]|nr:FixH family protein [Phaeodactylibacter sp.]